MPRKKQGDIPPSWQARKNGDMVATWVPHDAANTVRVTHYKSKWGKNWTLEDTWRATIRYGTPRVRMWMERDRVPRILWKLKQVQP